MADVFPTPSFRVPGLLDDEALAERMKLYTDQKNREAGEGPAPAAVEFADKIKTEFLDQPTRRATKEAEKLAPEPQPTGFRDRMRSDVTDAASSFMAGVGQYLPLGLLGGALAEGGPLAKLGTLSPEEQEVETLQRYDAAKEQEAATKRHIETREALRSLTDDDATQLGMPIQPGGTDSQTIAEEQQRDADILKSVEQRTAERREAVVTGQNMVEQSQWLSMSREALRGLERVPVQTMKLAPILFEAASGFDEKSGMRDWLDAVNKNFDAMLPPDKARAKDFMTEVASGTGSMAGFLTLTAMAGVAGIPTKAATFMIGAAQGASTQFEDAEQHKATAWQKYAALLAGAGVGATEAIPIDRMLLRAEHATGGLVSRMLANTAASSLEEFVQEFGQNIGEDVVAKWTYDENRKVDIVAALRAGAAGAISGGLSAAATTTLAEAGFGPQDGLTEQQAQEGNEEQAALRAAQEIEAREAQIDDFIAANQAQVEAIVAKAAGDLELVEPVQQDLAAMLAPVEAGQEQDLTPLVETIKAKGQQPITTTTSEFVAALPRPQLFEVSGEAGAGGTTPRLTAEGNITLRHYAPEVRETLDPEKMGTGDLRGVERERLFGDRAVPRTYYGVGGGPEFSEPAVSRKDFTTPTKPELAAAKKLGIDRARLVAELARRYDMEARARGYQPESSAWNVVHEVDVGRDDLYNIEEDPQNLRARIPEGATGNERLTEYEALIRDAGFKGYYRRSSELGQTAVLFEPRTPDRVLDRATNLPLDQIARPAEFDAPTPETFQKSGWAVVTGTQEADGAFDTPKNLRANAKLRKELRDRGIDFRETEGTYQGVPQGTSFLIFADEATAAELGAKYKQESILTKDGLVYTDGSERVTPARGVVLGDQARAADFQSTLPNGEAFSVDLDFDATAKRQDLFGAQAPVETPAFQRWFGDSKVVDENGDPLVVYHGTPGPAFREFEKGRAGVTSFIGIPVEVRREGFYFAEKKGFAKGFAEQSRARGGGSVMPVYLSIQNPLDVTSTDNATVARLEEVALRMQELDPSINGIDYIAGKAGDDSFWELLDTAEGGDVLVQAAKDLGYDGIRMIEQDLETSDPDYRPDDEGAVTWVAFDSTQIKSVDNSGAFDASNPDIFAAQQGKGGTTSSTRNAFKAEPKRKAGGIAQTGPVGAGESLAGLSQNFIKLMDLTARQGRLTLKGGAVGQYSSKQDTVRLKTWNDFSTLVHEGGHALHMSSPGPELAAWIKANQAELMTVARKLYGGDLSKMQVPEKIAEGFAEFFRVYVTNRAYAKKNNPTLTQTFDDLLMKTAPDLKAGLDAIGAGFQAWLQKPSTALLRDMVVSGAEPGTINRNLAEISEGGFGNWFGGVARSVIGGLVDRNAQLNRLVADVLNKAEDTTGRPLDLKRAEDPRVLIRLATNAGNRAIVQTTDGVMAYQSTDPSTRGLQEALLRYHGVGPDGALSAIDPVRKQDFAAYLIALRGIDEYRRFADGKIERPPLAATLGDLRQAVKDFDAQYGEDFKEAAKIVHEYGMGLWQKSYDAGLISKETYNEGLDRQFYAPLQRDLSDRDITTGDFSAAAARQGRSIVKRFKGSDRDIIDPMDILMQKTFALERTIAENDVKKALAALADRAGKAGALVERVPAHRLLGSEYSVQEVARQLTKDPSMTAQDAQDLMEMLEPAIEEGNRIALFRSQQAVARGENILFFWEQGKLAAIQLKDGDIGADIINTMNGIGRENMPIWLDTIAMTSSLFRGAVTKWPDFLLVNFIRDQASAFILTDVGYKPFVTGIRGVGDEIRQNGWARQYNAAMGVMGGMNSEALHRARVDRDIGALRAKGYLARAFDGTWAGRLRGFARVTELSETGTRLGIFRKAFDRAKADGLTDWEASIEGSYLATDYIDFSLSGNQMLIARRLVPFLNAQLQGLYKLARTLGASEVAQRKGLNFALRAFFKDVNGLDLSRTERQAIQTGRKAWAKMASLALLGAALALAYRDNEDYQDASEYLRATGWVIPLGEGRIFYIPKPFELAVFSNFAERAIEYGSGDDSAPGRFLRGLAMNLSPPTTPPVLGVAVEEAANYNFFNDTDIVPEYMRALAPELQYNARTSEFAKQLGAMLGWSPLRIDHVMSGLGASAYRDLSSMYNSVATGDRPSSDVTDWPVTRRFIRDARRGSASSQDFWKYASTADGTLRRAELTYRNYLEAGQEQAANEFLNGLEPDERAYALLNAHFKPDAKRLNPFYRARQINTVISAMRRELYSPLGVDDTTTKVSEPMQISAKTKGEIDKALAELARREMRNTLIYANDPGWKGKTPLPTDTTMALLLQIHPGLQAELSRRLKKAKVYSAETVQEYWPEARNRLLSDRENAFLGDLVSVAKVTAQ